MTIDDFRLTIERPGPTRQTVGSMRNEAKSPGPCTVTDVVKVGKLTKDVITFYPHPSAEPVLQINGLFEIKPVLRSFFATKSRRILQFSAKTCKKTTGKTGFSRPVLLKRVKSCGSCQSVIGAPCFQNRREQHGGVQAPRIKPGGGHGLCFGLLPAQSALECGSFWLGCNLAVKVAERPFPGSPGATASLRGQSIDSTMVVRQVPQPTKPRHDEFKGLTSHASGGGRTTFSGFVGGRKRGETYLLIPKWLLAKLLRRAGEGLLNLKDLLTVFPPRLKGLFENEPVLRPLFCAESHQIAPFSSKNVQIMAGNDGFSRPILLKGGNSRLRRGQPQAPSLLGCFKRIIFGC